MVDTVRQRSQKISLRVVRPQTRNSHNASDQFARVSVSLPRMVTDRHGFREVQKLRILGEIFSDSLKFHRSEAGLGLDRDRRWKLFPSSSIRF
ncbi:hypothetical protein CKO51_17215 [Rhodopirellula sp. SM50]|nr:hypothetical protein CKO51_17215 [Rhodopirellula sp. SM50]